MNIHDQHIHTSLSFDSEESIEKYLDVIKDSQKYFINTEHKEFSNIIKEYKSFDLDDIKYQSKYDQITILKGIEIGYNIKYIDEIKNYIKDNDFDLVILSIHDDSYKDYMFLDKLDSYQIEAYYNKVFHVVSNMDNFSLGHLDYPFRYNTYTIEELDHPLVDVVLKTMITKNIALEFNTTSAYSKNNLFYYQYLFNKYYELKGNSILLTSDAHNKDMYKYKFKESLILLQEIGFKYISYYIKQVEYKVLIKEVLKYE